MWCCSHSQLTTSRGGRGQCELNSRAVGSLVASSTICFFASASNIQSLLMGLVNTGDLSSPLIFGFELNWQSAPRPHYFTRAMIRGDPGGLGLPLTDVRARRLA